MKITGLEHLKDFNRILRAAVKRGPVLVCYLDGLGWYGYEEAVKRQAVPFIREHFFVNPMETVQPPLTNPAMATMLTGVLPDVHGVVSRKQHRTLVPTVFSDVPDGILVEGDTIIIQTEVEQLLHTEAEAGNIDYSVFKDGMEQAKTEPPLLFLHFHGIDDAGHTFGPYAAETLEKIREIDEYIKQLAECWQGEIFLISDHGLHEVEEGNGGDHGKDNLEDRTVIFGWHTKKTEQFPEIVPVAGMLELLAHNRDVSKIVFTGRDGYASVCSEQELQKEPGPQLRTGKGETCGSDTQRLAFPEEPIARRWCKDVTEVSVKFQ